MEIDLQFFNLRRRPAQDQKSILSGDTVRIDSADELNFHSKKSTCSRINLVI